MRIRREIAAVFFVPALLFAETCTYEVSAREAAVGLEGGWAEFFVATQPGCTIWWSTNDDWIRASQPPGQPSFLIQRSPVPRVGSVTVVGRPYKIRQGFRTAIVSPVRLIRAPDVRVEWLPVPHSDGYLVELFRREFIPRRGEITTLIQRVPVAGGNTRSVTLQIGPGGPLKVAYVRACFGGFDSDHCGPRNGEILDVVGPPSPGEAMRLLAPQGNSLFFAVPFLAQWSADAKALSYRVRLYRQSDGRREFASEVEAPETFVDVPALDPGDYRFELAACADGCADPLVAQFRVLPDTNEFLPTMAWASEVPNAGLLLNFGLGQWRYRFRVADERGETVAARYSRSSAMLLPLPLGSFSMYTARCPAPNDCGHEIEVAKAEVNTLPDAPQLLVPAPTATVRGRAYFRWVRDRGDDGSGVYRLTVRDLANRTIAFEAMVDSDAYLAELPADGTHYEAQVSRREGDTSRTSEKVRFRIVGE